MNNISTIMSNYGAENPAIRAKLWQLFNHGALVAQGKLLIYPIDQGFEHGPDRSFLKNDAAYDPHYHFKIAVQNKFNAFAAPVGLLDSIVDSELFGQIPLILKMNSANILYTEKNPRQVVYSDIQRALQLGCIGIGLTIYPGSSNFNNMIAEIKNIIAEAKRNGLLVIIWSYPRGEKLQVQDENALDVIAYAAHLAALLGGHIIKVKLPSEHIFDPQNQTLSNMFSLTKRVQHIVKSSFTGKRIVIFSGGKSKKEEDLLNEIKAIKDGGGFGSIVGRNIFQRSEQDAVSLIQKIINIYQS